VVCWQNATYVMHPQHIHALIDLVIGLHVLSLSDCSDCSDCSAHEPTASLCCPHISLSHVLCWRHEHRRDAAICLQTKFHTCTLLCCSSPTSTSWFAHSTLCTVAHTLTCKLKRAPLRDRTGKRDRKIQILEKERLKLAGDTLATVEEVKFGEVAQVITASHLFASESLPAHRFLDYNVMFVCVCV
jgi:hypothetical protein